MSEQSETGPANLDTYEAIAQRRRQTPEDLLAVVAYARQLQKDNDRLRAHVLDIDAHATPYGDIPDDPGWVGMYLLTAGALHRALGTIGHTAPSCQAEAELAQRGELLGWVVIGHWESGPELDHGRILNEAESEQYLKYRRGCGAAEHYTRAEVRATAGESDIREAVERSSLGTPEAKAARASVSDQQAARVVARVNELAREGEGSRGK